MIFVQIEDLMPDATNTKYECVLFAHGPPPAVKNIFPEVLLAVLVPSLLSDEYPPG